MDPYKPPPGETVDASARDQTTTRYSRKFSRRGGYVALAIHSAAVIGFAFLVYSGLSHSAEAAMAWNLWMMIDFPISIGAIPSELVLKPQLIDTIGFDYFYGFAFGAYFLVFGGLQYYLVFGWLVCYIARRRNVES